MSEHPNSQRNRSSEERQSRPQGRFVQQGVMAVLRASLAGLGLVLVPSGVVIALATPILPIGLPIVILGVVLVARNAPWGRRFFQAILARYPRLERFAPDWLLRLIFGDHDKAAKEQS